MPNRVPASDHYINRRRRTPAIPELSHAGKPETQDSVRLRTQSSSFVYVRCEAFLGKYR
jgi:hypothetical protein